MNGNFGLAESGDHVVTRQSSLNHPLLLSLETHESVTPVTVFISTLSTGECGRRHGESLIHTENRNIVVKEEQERAVNRLISGMMFYMSRLV